MRSWRGRGRDARFVRERERGGEREREREREREKEKTKEHDVTRTLLERPPHSVVLACFLVEYGNALHVCNFLHQLSVQTLAPFLLPLPDVLGKRKLAHGDFIHDDAQRVNVHLFVVAVASEELGLFVLVGIVG